MFNKLSERLTKTLRGIKTLNEKNIEKVLSDIRRALLEADVSLSIVKDFIEQVRQKALGTEIHRSIQTGHAFVKIVNDELVRILGDQSAELNLNAQPPVVILIAGLQGSGKTTTVAKLAYSLKTRKDKKVLVTSTDVYRPAAIEQLKTLAKQVDVHYFPSTTKDKPVKIAREAIQTAKKQFLDVVIIDTAGRLHIDENMMHEITNISKAINPTETLLVVDSMAGQDAANIAKNFNDHLELTGIILTKTDGDARGGAALSMRMITGKPIKFMGVGEKIDALEAFHPDRMASRILGMGDIVSLVEEAKHKIDQQKADKIHKKLKKGKRFDLTDFLDQLQQMDKLGGMEKILGKLPTMPNFAQGKINNLMGNKKITQMKAIIYSMTPQERIFPALINGSRKRRIASGSGTSIQEVNQMLRQFEKLQKQMKRFKGNKMGKMMKQMKHLQGQLPPELKTLQDQN